MLRSVNRRGADRLDQVVILQSMNGPNTLQFDDLLVRSLTADPEQENFCRQVSKACYSRVRPTPVSAPSVVAVSREMVTRLGLSADAADTDWFRDVFSGNQVLDGMDPYANCYGGHQFGGWAGQLGDGRAITLGEVIGQNQERWEIQLKGAGPTPYSRRGDGRAVMRSSVREFLCSEAMHHLGVPTTRALSLVGTGDEILRDMFYDGRARYEPGAIVCRVAPSFLRFGSFEVLAWRKDAETLEKLATYALTTFFPHLGPPGREGWLRMLVEVCEQTARMVTHWMRVGFVHGVMNTDNMSLLGLTIDYGPYGWLEGYQPDWTPNTTDSGRRRYCFGNQPRVAEWNLTRFAESLYPLVGEAEPLEEALQVYSQTLKQAHDNMAAAKLGLGDALRAAVLYEELVPHLQRVETDMTIFFRRLAEVPCHEDASDEERLSPLLEAYYDEQAFRTQASAATAQWLRAYCAQVRTDAKCDTHRRTAMNAVNPKYVLRNYLAQLAIDEAEKGDGTKVMELLDVLRHPYSEQPEHEQYAVKRPEWARHRPGCSTLSCSS